MDCCLSPNVKLTLTYTHVLYGKSSVWFPTFITARHSLSSTSDINRQTVGQMVTEYVSLVIDGSDQLVVDVWTNIYWNNNLLDMSNELELRRVMFSAMNAITTVGSAFVGRSDNYITSIIRETGVLPNGYSTQTTYPNGTMFFYAVDNKTCDTIGPLSELQYGYAVDQIWYKSAEAERSTSWTSIYNGAAAGSSLIISLGRPVFYNNETASFLHNDAPADAPIVAVVGISLFLSQLSTYLSGVNMGAQGRIFIVERDGNLVASSVGSVSVLVNGTYDRLPAIDHSDIFVRETAQYIVSNYGGFLSLNSSSFQFTTTNNIDLVVQILVFTDQFGLNWLICIVSSYTELYGKVKQGSIISGVISLVAVLLSVIVSFFIGLLITIPIRQVTNQLYRVANMELDSPKRRTESGTSLYEISNMQKALRRMKEGLQNFAKYVPGDIVRQMLVSGSSAEPGVRNAYLTVFFSDIIGFTNLTENTSPHILVALMQDFFTNANQLIQQQEGTIDKYVSLSIHIYIHLSMIENVDINTTVNKLYQIGDCIMAFWGAPLKVEDPEIKAIKAALLLKDMLTVKNAEWIEKGYPPIYIRTGINSANCLVGNIGAPSRLNYTVLGDGVNLASRLESLNNSYRTKIMIGESTFAKVQDEVACRWLDYVTVKGKDRPIHVYEVLALKSQMTESELKKQVEQYMQLRDMLMEGHISQMLQTIQNMMAGMDEEELGKHVSLQMVYSRLSKDPNALYQKFDAK
jgi:class 3 adenylate cyclase